MKSKEDLINEVNLAELALFSAKEALQNFIDLPENNVYADLPTAIDTVTNKLEEKAFNDCVGAGNCGLESYEQLFIVNEDTYLGTLYCEYNSHDKTFYYIEDSRFEYVKQ